MMIPSSLSLSSLLIIFLSLAAATKPAPAKFFDKQHVDHVNGTYAGQYWSQRYYTWEKEFKGPGHPIFLIFGGEGTIEPEVGIHYPYITDHLAKSFGAFVIQPEHRFYGASQPLANNNNNNITKNSNNNDNTTDPRVVLFTAEQAIRDAIQLVLYTQNDLKCSRDMFSKDFCPVIAVGGSYPGYLSAMARVLFPRYVQMSYAASAPMKFYSQQVEQEAYYEHITKVAEKSLAGCAKLVRSTLDTVKHGILSKSIANYELGICNGTLPDYITTPSMLVDELFMIIGYTFANDNMANYPPNNNNNNNATMLHRACQTFTNPNKTAVAKVKEFFISHLNDTCHCQCCSCCFNMSSQLPTGKHATISSGDWSGVGTGSDGESWDFQTCTLLVEAIGFSNASMFPPRSWSMDWLTQHCASRFNVTPEPYRLVNSWHFDQLEKFASRILFTNGLNDGWSVGGILKPLSKDLPVINFPNGAHHSDLSAQGPSDEDTDDIKNGFIKIQAIFADWLNSLPSTMQGNHRYPIV